MSCFRRIALVCLAVLPSLSCAELLANLNSPSAGITPPTIEFQGATLARTPTQTQMAAFYCPQVVPAPFGIPGGAGVLCSGFFGPPPPQQEMSIAFDLRFKVKNPNQVPLPLAEILTGITVFPSRSNQNLGAVCMKLCPPGSVGCSGVPDASSCQASSRDIRSMQDFGQAAADLLISSGLTMAAGGTPTFVAPQVSAASDLDVVVRFSFGVNAMSPMLRELARQSMQQLKAGSAVEFRIPYRLEGTVWLDGGSFGRVAVGYGPLAGEWTVPGAGLVQR